MSEREELPVGSFPFVPKQERAQQKRKALEESGLILFIEKGYEHTTAKEIAAHAGVAIGTFYRYFSDKRQLLLSLLEDKIEQMLPPEPEWVSGDPVTKLHSLLEAHAARLDKSGLHRVLPELMLKDPEFAEIIAVARKKIYEGILSGINQAQERGLTWPDIDVETVAWSIMVLVENGHQEGVHGGKKVDLYELAKVICRLVFPPDTLIKLRTEDQNESS
ncbi:TetR/AcrR family transcriptional regulator [Neobacillus niacini]|uniref:TetR/AcrR family transcriptional regulator n=1 Tax=Neobacillus niacini TaxID=86668 RepID=UPI0021CB3B36|nr:TetR/AcrR family transcriptional regulator [Neobacillus niacini]MCM3764365.1 TetR/AcrR family transcriptional regulator [Neobacillus niacini]